MGQIKVDCDQGANLVLPGNLLSSLKCPANDIGILTCISSESLVQTCLLMQAQMLIRKNNLYESIIKEINGLFKFQPTVFAVLPCQTPSYNDCEKEDGPELPLLSFHRDVAISNLRFLSIFYNSGPNSFYVATNLMDRLLSRMTVARRALPIVASCCFYLATCYTNASSIPIDLDDLMKLTQCDTTREIFLEVASRIRDEIGFCQQRPVTPLSFLKLFYSVFELQDERLQDGRVEAFLISRLGLFLCQFEFTKFRYDLLALACLQYFLQQIGFLDNSKQLTLLELQYYCRMDEDAYRECFSMIERYTFEYETQATKRPKLKLNWTISRRVLLKRRPSLHVRSNLEPVLEEESTSVPYDVGNEFFQGEVRDNDFNNAELGGETEETASESGDEERSSDCRNQGNESSLNDWKVETDLTVSEDEKSREQRELCSGDDSVSVDEEISSSASVKRCIDESASESDKNEERLEKVCNDETGNKEDFDELESGVPEADNSNDSTVSEKLETHERKASCGLPLDLKRVLHVLDGCDQSSRKLSSSVVDGENDSKFTVGVVVESSAEMNGGIVPPGNDALSSKVDLLSDDNNNCIVGVI